LTGVLLIEFHDVSVRYRAGRGREVQALENINLRIDSGEWIFFVGPTGAGKSTLLKLIYGGAQPAGGQIIVDGRDITHLPQQQIPWLRRKLGVVFQDFQLLEQKSVWENVAFALQVTGTPQHKLATAVARALDTVGLNHRALARPRELSGGEQQRAAIARAIVNEPLILLADEPTGNLDPQTGSEIAEVLQRVNERGTTVVMATHDRALVDALRRRVVRFAAGRLVADEEHGGYLPAGVAVGAQTELSSRSGNDLVDALLNVPQPQTEARGADNAPETPEPDSQSSPPAESGYDTARPWTTRTTGPTVHPGLKNKAPIGSAENPLVVGIDNEEF
jgi:cell division transport system ATP-binding protein